MRTKNHTPGPWRHDETWGLIVNEKGHEIAACHAGRTGNKTETQANARLLAAAPELLESLKNGLSLLQAIEKETGYCTAVTQAAWAELILKADGSMKPQS